MPGTDYTLRCPACGAHHAVRTGYSLSFAFEQLVCHRCEELRSTATEEDVVPGPCPDCGLQLEPWRGRVWHVAGEERLEGPCPACFAILTHEDAIERSTWD